MIIGVNNIFTVIWYLIILICYLIFSSLVFENQIFSGHLMLPLKVGLAVFMVGILGILIFLLFKFRILVIWRKRLFYFQPFMLRIKSINLNQQIYVKWNSWELFSMVWRTLEIANHKDQVIRISDLEFENFDQLICRIPGAQSHGSKAVVDFKQARSNLNLVMIVLVLSVLMLIIIALVNIQGMRYSWIHNAIFITVAFSTYGAAKRRRKYQRHIRGNYGLSPQLKHSKSF